MAMEHEFDCPLCLEVVFTPVETYCHHVFCLDCLRSAVQVNPSCPSCRAPLDQDAGARLLSDTNPLAFRLLLHVPNVRCRRSGCTFVGRDYQSLLHHIQQDCGQYVNCPQAELGCTFRCTSKELATHVDKCIYVRYAGLLVEMKGMTAKLAEAQSENARLLKVVPMNQHPHPRPHSHLQQQTTQFYLQQRNNLPPPQYVAVQAPIMRPPVMNRSLAVAQSNFHEDWNVTCGANIRDALLRLCVQENGMLFSNEVVAIGCETRILPCRTKANVTLNVRNKSAARLTAFRFQLLQASVHPNLQPVHVPSVIAPREQTTFELEFTQHGNHHELPSCQLSFEHDGRIQGGILTLPLPITKFFTPVSMELDALLEHSHHMPHRLDKIVASKSHRDFEVTQLKTVVSSGFNMCLLPSATCMAVASIGPAASLVMLRIETNYAPGNSRGRCRVTVKSEDEITCRQTMIVLQQVLESF